MTTFDLQKAFYSKKFHKFTGPPENWLTAIKFMTWGLEEKHMSAWAKISVGDIFFMHSTADSKYKNAKSSIVGLGIVGPGLKRKDNLLWIQEINDQKNKWPLLVPFSEIYLYSSLPPSDQWEAPGFEKNDPKIQVLVDQLLKRAMPLSLLKEKQTTGSGFPIRGSLSPVGNDATKVILDFGVPDLYGETDIDITDTTTKLEEIHNVEQTMRYIPTLKFLKKSQPKLPGKKVSFIEKNNTLLERAEAEHSQILQAAIDYFNSNGYKTYSNIHVDLFAVKEEKSFLIEVKSTSNDNFRSQARKAISQLFEYEYFDIKDFITKEKIKPQVQKTMMVANDPNDKDYSKFLRHLYINLNLFMGNELININK